MLGPQEYLDVVFALYEWASDQGDQEQADLFLDECVRVELGGYKVHGRQATIRL